MSESGRPLPVQSLLLQSNEGNVPVTVCGCGVMLFRNDIAWLHIDACPVVRAHVAGGGGVG